MQWSYFSYALCIFKTFIQICMLFLDLPPSPNRALPRGRSSFPTRTVKYTYVYMNKKRRKLWMHIHTCKTGLLMVSRFSSRNSHSTYSIMKRALQSLIRQHRQHCKCLWSCCSRIFFTNNFPILNILLTHDDNPPKSRHRPKVDGHGVPDVGEPPLPLLLLLHVQLSLGREEDFPQLLKDLVH